MVLQLHLSQLNNLQQDHHYPFLPDIYNHVATLPRKDGEPKSHADGMAPPQLQPAFLPTINAAAITTNNTSLFHRIPTSPQQQ
jgi:hypothetical protein